MKADTEWYCLACAHIHKDSQPPELCPVCGAGPENFGPLQPEDGVFRQDSDESFVVVGGGIAALSAAESIRYRNRSAHITLVSAEPVLPYYRPALSDYLGGELSEAQFYVKPSAWYSEQRIDVLTGTAVAGINTGQRQLNLSSGVSLSYDKLILATGARSNIPDLPGVDLQGVYALRSYQDAGAIKAALAGAQAAVIIGGGVLGLEAAWEMAGLGKKVVIVEHNSRLMPRQLDVKASRRLEDLARGYGLEIYLASDVRCLQGDGKVNAVELTDGKIIAADLVLLSTGVKPNLEIAQKAGIETERGIVVDGFMQTSVAGVFAAGDVAQFSGNLIGLWPIALQMGRIAGANAAGDRLEYKPPRASTLLAAFDMEIFSLGDVNPPLTETRVEEIWDPVENYFKRSFIKGGILIGEIVISPRVAAASSFTGLGSASGADN